jgi:hypothetical protein
MDKTNTIVDGAEDIDLEDSTNEETENIEEESELDTENDVDVDPNKDADEEDDGLTYDEDGNVIIPEDDDDASHDGEQTDEETDTETKETPAVNSESKKAEEQSNTEPDEVTTLKAELEKLKRRSKAALKALGVESDDVESGLVQIAAEAEGVSEEEYLNNIAEEEAKEKQAEITFAQVVAADLKSLKDVYPACASYKAITDIPNVKRFAELRELGLSAVEAFAATNRNLINSGSNSPKGSKSHLQTVVPKGATGGDNLIPRSEFNQLKELFPDLSNKEIIKLYNKSILLFV